jgi:hypothetical protein
MLFAKSKIVSKASTATVSSDHGVWKTQPGRAQQESLVRKVKIAGIAEIASDWGVLRRVVYPGSYVFTRHLYEFDRTVHEPPAPLEVRSQSLVLPPLLIRRRSPVYWLCKTHIL